MAPWKKVGKKVRINWTENNIFQRDHPGTCLRILGPSETHGEAAQWGAIPLPCVLYSSDNIQIHKYKVLHFQKKGDQWYKIWHSCVENMQIHKYKVLERPSCAILFKSNYDIPHATGPPIQDYLTKPTWVQWTPFLASSEDLVFTEKWW